MKLINTIGLVMLFAMRTVNALESDPDQPIYVDSNSAVYDERTEVSTYTGNVVATQGSIRIDAEQLVVYMKGGGINKLIATGKPSRFKQLPAVGKDEIHGEGLVNEFYPEKNLLIFKQNASVWQGDAKQSSDLIEYDTKNSLLKAGASGGDGSRVHSVIKPKAKKAP